ncbi:hypothetical protein [Helicobacter acinonychis]|uniref:hypothetical protein n=1 Tax=Helicobacter acinonychis TaxID=212 RepID=UPI000CF05E27|nr:hypothetical protein [Helicobacter acinonychis]
MFHKLILTCFLTLVALTIQACGYKAPPFNEKPTPKTPNSSNSSMQTPTNNTTPSFLNEP